MEWLFCGQKGLGATDHGVTKSRRALSTMQEHFRRKERLPMLGDFAGDTEGWRPSQSYNPSFGVASLPLFLILSQQDLLSDSGNVQPAGSLCKDPMRLCGGGLGAGVGSPRVCLLPVIYLNYLRR